MRVAAVADLHGHYPEIPECDLLLVAGDFGSLGKVEDWLRVTPADRVVACAGNHDFVAETHPGAVASLPWTYLQDAAIDVDGLTVYGSPWTSPFFDWAFMLPEDKLAEKWALIPEDTNILLTHSPPHGLGDLVPHAHEDDPHRGSASLRAVVEQLPALKLHVFGHIHEGHGRGDLPQGAVWANCSLVDAAYRPFQSRVQLFEL